MCHPLRGSPLHLYASTAVTQDRPLDWSPTLGGPAYCPEETIVPDRFTSLDGPGDVSLVTGRARVCKLSMDGALNGDHGDNGSVMIRGEWAVADANVSKTASTRTWYGLDPQLGQTPVVQLREGLHGVPTHYTTETDVTSGNSP
ncbi:hypothetical protein AHF37_07373 [Paragonimus kellicotti]|nr:hypothetical protein AHF37_07373 [Paragonimus kellicotti]